MFFPILIGKGDKNILNLEDLNNRFRRLSMFILLNCKLSLKKLTAFLSFFRRKKQPVRAQSLEMENFWLVFIFSFIRRSLMVLMSGIS